MEAKQMKLLTLTKLIAFCGLVASSSALFSMAPTKSVIAIHTSSIGPNEDKGAIIKNALTVAPRILWKHPSILLKVGEIVERGKRIAREIQGTGNIVHALLEEFNLLDYEEAILKIAMAPLPNQETKEFVEKAKRDGHKVILITNRDTADYKIYKGIMADKGSDLDALFDGVVTMPTIHTIDLGDQDYIVNPEDQNHYIAKAALPDASFSQAMRALADKLNVAAPVWCLPEPKKAQEYAPKITDNELNIHGFSSLNELKAELEIDASASATARTALPANSDALDPFDDFQASEGEERYSDVD
jgi:hypothetical protein